MNAAPRSKDDAGAPGLVRRMSLTVGHMLGHEALPQMAAALAYRTIFSIIPILLLGFLTLRLFRDTNSLVERLLAKLLEQSGLSRVAGDGAGQFNLQAWITERVAEFSGINFTGIGLVSAAVLIYAAISLLIEVEGSFNIIYSARRGRSFSRRIVQYWMVLSLGPMLLYASFIAGENFQDLAVRLAGEGGAGLGTALLQVAGYVTTVCISTVLLLILYIVVPNTRVRFGSALAGALTAAVMLELAKTGFSIYVQHAGYKSLYGQLSLLPLFLFWVYLTWLLVLFGLRLSYLVQFDKLRILSAAWRGTAVGRSIGSLRLGGGHEHGLVFANPDVVVLVAAEVARSFALGTPAEPAAVAESLRIDLQLTRRVLERLTEAGLTHHVAAHQEGDGPHGFALSRPAERIPLIELLNISLVRTQGEGTGPEAPARGAEGSLRFLESLREARRRTAGERTLAELLEPTNESTPTAAGTLDDRNREATGLSSATTPAVMAGRKASTV